MLKVPVLYVAAPVGAGSISEVCANVSRAQIWLSWLIDNEPGHAFAMPWLGYVNVLDDQNPEHRARGLRDSCSMAALCDGLVLVGGRISGGMQAEIDAVMLAGGVVYDLTGIGQMPPSWPLPAGRRRVDVLGQECRTPLAYGRDAWLARR